MKTLNVLIFTLFTTSLAIGQGISFTQEFGHIIDNDGNKITGIISIKHASYPWSQQDDIFFYETDAPLDEETKLKKADMTKYKPTEIKGFSYDGREFNTIKYTNVAGLSKAAGLKGGLNQLSAGAAALGDGAFFAEVVVKGELVSLYKYYNKPPGFSISSGEETEKLAQMSEDAKTEYDLLLSKPDGKAKNTEVIIYKKYFKDCKKWVKNFENGDYDFPEKLNKKGKKAKIQIHTFKEKMDRYKLMISEYDSLCK